jgi:hypothetical protein
MCGPNDYYGDTLSVESIKLAIRKVAELLPAGVVGATLHDPSSAAQRHDLVGVLNPGSGVDLLGLHQRATGPQAAPAGERGA